VADVRPFRALRYDPAIAGDPSRLIAPPYDVIGPEEQRRLYAASPYNIVRLECGEDRPGDAPGHDRYARAAAELRRWREEGVLVLDERPRLYLYEQEFIHEGPRRRRALLAIVRLEPWERGVILPHERTLPKPKEDRLRLLRSVRANVSPVFGLYRDRGALGELIASEGPPLLEATTPDGQRHRLLSVSPERERAIAAAFGPRSIYIADGHHRYETALAYRDERRALAEHWTGEEPENFVLMALVAADDPGLVVLPTHRLVHPPVVPHDLVPRLSRFFDIEDVTPKSWDGTALLRLLARLAAAGRETVAFGALGLEEQRYHLLLLTSFEAVEPLLPPDKPSVWRRLDAAVLQHVVLKACLGIDESAVAAGHVVTYTEDAEQARLAVEHGRARLAFLLNPPPVEQILAVADTGERMPQKSTYFYPKLATGLALYPFE
jgi:uncharacterized protein (DUF1015 family)